MLLSDGTYFVLEAGGELVGCGGWSRFPPLGGGAEAVNQALLGRGGHLVRQHASSVGRQ
jgi:hypothetical protein